jgi:hypothetical protein
VGVPAIGQDHSTYDNEATQANVRDSEGAGTTTLTSFDKRHQVFNLSASRTVVMPSAGILKGEKWILENRGAFDLVPQASNTTQIQNNNTTDNAASGSVGDPTIRVGMVVLEAMQDTPTTPAHWRVADVYEEGSIASTTAGAITTAVTMKYVRKGTSIVQNYNNTSGTASGSSDFIRFPAADMPVRFRIPTGHEMYLAGIVRDNSTPVIGRVVLSDNGQVTFAKLPVTNFTGASAMGAGGNAPASISYHTKS